MKERASVQLVLNFVKILEPNFFKQSMASGTFETLFSSSSYVELEESRSEWPRKNICSVSPDLAPRTWHIVRNLALLPSSDLTNINSAEHLKFCPMCEALISFNISSNNRSRHLRASYFSLSIGTRKTSAKRVRKNLTVQSVTFKNQKQWLKKFCFTVEQLSACLYASLCQPHFRSSAKSSALSHWKQLHYFLWRLDIRTINQTHADLGSQFNIDFKW